MSVVVTARAFFIVKPQEQLSELTDVWLDAAKRPRVYAHLMTKKARETLDMGS